MYTRCTDCKTVFHITAAELRAAEGTVICGACGSTFDALETLSETRPQDPSPTILPHAPDPDVPEQVDLVRDEDEFLEELESLIGPDATDDELEASDRYGSHHIDDDRDEAEAAGEPRHVELDEPEDAVPDIAAGALAQDESGEFGEFADILGDELDEGLDDAIPDPDSVFRVDDVPEELSAGPDEPFVGVEASPATAPAQDDWRARLAARAEHGHPVDAEDEADELPGFDAQPRRSRAWPKMLLLLLALLILAGTWAHTQRGKLLRLPAGQAVLEPVYQRLGIDASPDWDLAAYRAIQWEAVADAGRPDDLSVAVDFQNAAGFAQPYPIIRIMLDDRFGRRLGMHDVSPAEYQRGHSSHARIPAGGRVRTTVVVPDPSGRAASFRVDFCLELTGRGLVCGPQPFR